MLGQIRSHANDKILTHWLPNLQKTKVAQTKPGHFIRPVAGFYENAFIESKYETYIVKLLFHEAK